MASSDIRALCSLAALVALAFVIAALSGPEPVTSTRTAPATWQTESPEQDPSLDRPTAPAVTQPRADIDRGTEGSRSVTEGATPPDHPRAPDGGVEPVRAVSTKAVPLSGRPLGDGSESLAPRQLANGKNIFGY